MTDPKQIPHLINLLDDESPAVHRSVLKELASFGPTLKGEVRKQTFDLNPIQKKNLNIIFRSQKRLWLKQSWHSWFSLNTDYAKLEKALTILSKFLSDPDSEVSLKCLLDDLAKEYRLKYKRRNALQLAHFLFKEKKLSGEEDNYYNPLNSDLCHVIQNKKGIPISLTSVYMLVAARLGIVVEGCHFPGHFLARIEYSGKKAFVDCFSSGQIIEEKDIIKVKEEAYDDIETILNEKASAETMIRRCLANLIRAFQMKEDIENSQLMIELFKDIDVRMTSKQIAHLTPEEIIQEVTPSFGPGEVVRHARYGYRGIIVDCDNNCEATDSWYNRNQSQPDRDQCWFHVLVDGSDQVTYVAESSLKLDDSREKIEHPLLTYFFIESNDGQYIRNDNPWPDSDF